MMYSGHNDATSLSTLKSLLDDQFKLKHLGVLKYFLGLEITGCAKGISICQRKHGLELLHDTGFLG